VSLIDCGAGHKEMEIVLVTDDVVLMLSGHTETEYALSSRILGKENFEGFPKMTVFGE